MGQKSNFSAEQKLKYVLRCIEGKDSINHIASLAGIGCTTLRQWIDNYQSLGFDGLSTTSKNSRYSTTLKYMAVKDYLDGIGSLSDICKKYRIRSNRQLRNWVSKYNSHEKLKASGTGGVPIMTNGRKTTYDEKVEIVKYCIEHQNNYAETAEKYMVSYQQVYTWVNKYDKDGVEALQDKRGKRKDEDEMSELEKLRAMNKLLEAENHRKQMEIDFLKKLKDIEGRRS
ncbi:helix-turn-helix domain-containing protein [Cellulosilyticum sp. I15G10I2]|uniref:helix-turn-helix domain-containing protein n=1 Tax=Cellulosilyticum sp. I15G10I2 TaxID=1892843 RepID=UPI00085C0DDF|nr:helix-turn-helix domain-containing protein [Cellulosilyticum sp. I15G10I2]